MNKLNFYEPADYDIIIQQYVGRTSQTKRTKNRLPIHGPNSLATVSVEGKTAVLLCRENVDYCTVNKLHILEEAPRIFDRSEVFDESLGWKRWCTECHANITPQSRICGYTDNVRFPYPD
ncbi:hypothetical protein HY612_01320 [Candidatus Roizmanbacteria bacterium]|nr:hypothetical protein [Candidatus Roizmanbacteria bacterium]